MGFMQHHTHKRKETAMPHRRTLYIPPAPRVSWIKTVLGLGLGVIVLAAISIASMTLLMVMAAMVGVL